MMMTTTTIILKGERIMTRMKARKLQLLGSYSWFIISVDILLQSRSDCGSLFL